jgi:hypothetical protein
MTALTSELTASPYYRAIERLMSTPDVSGNGVRQFIDEIREGLGGAEQRISDRDVQEALRVLTKRAHMKMHHFLALNYRGTAQLSGRPITATSDGRDRVRIDDLIRDASEWIDGASRSTASATIASALREFVFDCRPLANVSTLEALHRRVAPNVSHGSKRFGFASNTLPSTLGMALLRGTLRLSAVSAFRGEDLGLRLLAWIIGYHAFSDGNGRTGRAAYAIALIREGRFTRLTRQQEDALHGLDLNFPPPSRPALWSRGKGSPSRAADAG